MKPWNIKTLGLILMAVALATVVINELRPLQSNSIYLLLAAGLAAILPYLKSFKAGGVEVNLKELIEGKMDEVKQEVQTQATELEKKVEIQTQAVQKEAQENREKIQTEIQEKIQTAQSSLQEQVSSVAAQAARAVKREAQMVWEIGGVPGGARKTEERSFAAPKIRIEMATPTPTEAATLTEILNKMKQPEAPLAKASDAALQQFVRSLKIPADLDPDDDTWALVDQFKNLPAANSERALTANVEADEDDPDWYHIRVRLAPVGSGKPIEGRVYFLVHHTFPQAKVPVTAKNGQATLERYAYGAFTIIALADGGKTQLALDLATLPEVPIGFAEG